MGNNRGWPGEKEKSARWGATPRQDPSAGSGHRERHLFSPLQVRDPHRKLQHCGLLRSLRRHTALHGVPCRGWREAGLSRRGVRGPARRLSPNAMRNEQTLTYPRPHCNGLSLPGSSRCPNQKSSLSQLLNSRPRQWQCTVESQLPAWTLNSPLLELL